MENWVVAVSGNTMSFTYQPVVESRWTGELEDFRKQFVQKFAKYITAATIGYTMFRYGSRAYAAVETGAEEIRKGFSQIIDVFTAIAEPILWFYALIGCIMMATGKNKDAGWHRIKQVGYAYIGIALLPTFFTFLRWMAVLVKGAVKIGG